MFFFAVFKIALGVCQILVAKAFGVAVPDTERSIFVAVGTVYFVNG